MKSTSMAQLLTGRGIWKVIVGILLALLSIPAQGEDGSSRKFAEPQPSANEGLTVVAPSDSAQPATPNAGTPPARSAREPSLEQVMELVQAQGRELETLRAALREQQELTARLLARLNSTGTGPVVARTVEEVSAEPVAAALAVSPSSASQGDVAQKVAKLEADVANSQKAMEGILKTFGPFVFSGDA